MALDDGPSILLDKPVLLIGRHPECDVQIDSRKISRKHCVIAQVNDYLIVRDLGSTNGVRINSIRVAEGRLANGDELTIGNNRYRLTWDTAPETPDSRKRRKAAARPAKPVHDIEDDILEECDEPIPLGEPGSNAPDLHLRPIAGAPLAHALPAAPHRGKALPSALPLEPAVRSDAPVGLPDDLELVPLSEVKPDRPSNHASGSPPTVEPV